MVQSLLTTRMSDIGLQIVADEVSLSSGWVFALMKILTWNVNRATESRTGVWEMVRRENADIVLLQEVNSLPDSILSQYRCHQIRPRYFNGSNAPFSSAVLSKGSIDAATSLKSDLEWIEKINKEQCGWIIGCEVTLCSGERFQVVTVHSPAFYIPRDLWTDRNVSDVKLTNNRDLWFTEILWSLLRNAEVSNDTNWIVGGDFNTSVNFDKPKNRGNQEIIDRLESLGLTDCLSHYRYGQVATYMGVNKVIEHQLDYLYVNAPMLARLTRSRVPPFEDVFYQKPKKLSDHLPVVCEFD